MRLMHVLSPRLYTRRMKLDVSSGAEELIVNNKMLKHDWFLTSLIYALMGCLRSKLSNLTCPITSICNRTGQTGQLSSQKKLSTSCH